MSVLDKAHDRGHLGRTISHDRPVPAPTGRAWELLRAAREQTDSSAGRQWCELHGLVPSADDLPDWWTSEQRCRPGPDGDHHDMLTGLPVRVTRKLDQATMVLIPGGSFLMGWTEEDCLWVMCNRARFDIQADVVEGVYQRRVILSPYYMDVYPVTNARFRQSRVRRRRALRGLFWRHHPATRVTWHDAMAYANWVGATLPTEAQWERAARGGQNCRYPWGNEPPDHSRANFEGHLGGTTPVGRFAQNPFGLYDMAGNVYDWCLDWYSPTYYGESPPRDPPGPPTGDEKVLRGGSHGRWADDDAGLLHVAFRHQWKPQGSSDYWGFRCVIPLHVPTTHSAPPYKKPHMPARASPQKQIGDVIVVELEHEQIWQKSNAGDVFDQLVARVRRRPRPKLVLDFSRVRDLGGAFALAVRRKSPVASGLCPGRPRHATFFPGFTAGTEPGRYSCHPSPTFAADC